VFFLSIAINIILSITDEHALERLEHIEVTIIYVDEVFISLFVNFEN
jgi:hypothetical protein